MALKLILDSLDAVDSQLHNFYEERDGKFHLKVDGIEDTTGLKSALEKERKAAKEAQKELRDATKKLNGLGDLEGIDIKMIKSLMSQLKGDEESQLLADGKIDEVVNMRVSKLREELEEQVKSKEEKLKKFSEKLLENHLVSAAAKAGVHKDAFEDAMSRGRGIFTIADTGDAVQLGEDGEPIPGKDGKSPYSALEWVEEMKTKAPHWFTADSSGGGATGSQSSGGDDFPEDPVARLNKARGYPE